MEKLKAFYTTNKKIILIIAGVAVAALVVLKMRKRKPRI